MLAIGAGNFGDFQAAALAANHEMAAFTDAFPAAPGRVRQYLALIGRQRRFDFQAARGDDLRHRGAKQSGIGHVAPNHRQIGVPAVDGHGKIP